MITRYRESLPKSYSAVVGKIRSVPTVIPYINEQEIASSAALLKMPSSLPSKFICDGCALQFTSVDAPRGNGFIDFDIFRHVRALSTGIMGGSHWSEVLKPKLYPVFLQAPHQSATRGFAKFGKP